MSLWAKLAADLHRHPKVRRGGRNAREVFVLVLAVNADNGSTGRVDAAFVDPWYLADTLQCTEAEAREGLEKAIAVRLLEITPEGYVQIVGWDDEEWGRGGGSMTERERKRLQRDKERELVKRPDTSGHVRTPGADVRTSGRSDQRRGEEKRGDQDPPQSPPRGAGVGSVKSKPRNKAFDCTPDERDAAERVLAKITDRTGVKYQGSDAHLRLIVGRLRDGVDELDLRAVIAYCWDALGWRDKQVGDVPMSEYLRPETLFGPQKLQQYLPSARKYRAELEAKPRAPPAPANGPRLLVADTGGTT
jgi:uncharacterized phage protein (TIGR02220 family)